MGSTENLMEKIREENISSTELADALGKTGEVPECKPINNNQQKVVGKITTLFCANGSNYQLHKEMREKEDVEVAVIFTHNNEGLAPIGELICSSLVNKHNARAIVIHGMIRDREKIVEMGYPVWCTGSTPIGCSNKKGTEYPAEKKEELKQKYEGAIAICDMTGVVAISNQQRENSLNVINAVEKIKAKEEVWKYFIEECKWSTYEVICEENYNKLNGESYDRLPENIKNRLKELKR